MNQRLRALCDLSMSAVREYIGRHEYDGRVEDLSPEGVRAALARLGGPPGTPPEGSGEPRGGAPVDREPDPHDEAQLAAFERLARLELGELELHRGQPAVPRRPPSTCPATTATTPRPTERAEARRRHLAAWPDAVDAAVAALDRVPAPVAEALLPAAKRPDRRPRPVDRDPVVERAVEAHKRLVAHLEAAAADGHPDTALGRGPLDRLLGDRRGPGRSTWAGWRSGPTPSGTGCGPCWTRPAGGWRPGRPTAEVVAGLLGDHPDADGVLARGRGPDGRVDRLHPGARPGARAGRRVPGRAGAPVAPVGPGHDVLGRPVRGRRPLPLLHLPARAGLAGRASRTTG